MFKKGDDKLPVIVTQ